MARLFDRLCQITVQDKKLVDLDVEFRVDRSLQPSQNTADFSIYNLSKDTRKHLSDVKGGVVVQLFAGYKSGNPLGAQTAVSESPPLIFLGKLRELTHLRDSADWITKVSSGDGDEKTKHPISFSLGPGTDLQSAVTKIVKDMGVGIGNSAQMILKGKFKDAGTQFAEGVVIHGNSGEELRKLLKSAGLEHSVQNGQLQVLEQGKALNTTAVKLSPSTGLIGSPEVGGKAKLKARSLMNAQIFPGRLLQIESESIQGFFRVDRAVYVGQRSGADWYVDIEASPRK